jgi:hypothetical protein
MNPTTHSRTIFLTTGSDVQLQRTPCDVTDLIEKAQARIDRGATKADVISTEMAALYDKLNAWLVEKKDMRVCVTVTYEFTVSAEDESSAKAMALDKVERGEARGDTRVKVV